MPIPKRLAFACIMLLGVCTARGQESDRPVYPQTTFTPPPVLGEFRMVPSSGQVAAGSTFAVTINLGMFEGSTARGGIIQITFPSALVSVNGGAAGVHASPESPFIVAPQITIQNENLYIPFVQPAFERVNYSGPLVTIDFAVAQGTEDKALYLIFNILNTRFSPVILETQLVSGTFMVVAPTPTPIPTPPPAGDFDSSGCTDVADFLYLIDYWQASPDGYPIGMSVFLDLLDHWQTGPSC